MKGLEQGRALVSQPMSTKIVWLVLVVGARPAGSDSSGAGVVGGEGDVVRDSVVEELYREGMSLLVPLLPLESSSDRWRSRRPPACPPEERDAGGDGVGGAAG